ncbi:hypothetical protein [Gilvibacter sp.]|uniref:hypothetical protein n=1 Tax=Gilvibacter sp. TaxID=2729997 RepID=UPI003F49CA8B
MMEHEELIQGYFKQSLSEADSQKVIRLLKDDAEFKAAFETYQEMHMAFKKAEYDNLKAQLQAVESKISEQTKPWYSQPWLRYAAASVLVIALGVNFFFGGSDNLYDDYFETYPNVYQPVIRGAASTSISDAFVFYENGEFEQAAASFKQLLEDQDDINLKFYRAMALLNAGDTQQALPLLEQLSETAFEFQAESKWYLALTYLKLDQTEKAKPLLEQMDAIDAEFKAEQRSSILKEI